MSTHIARIQIGLFYQILTAIDTKLLSFSSPFRMLFFGASFQLDNVDIHYFAAL